MGSPWQLFDDADLIKRIVQADSLAASSGYMSIWYLCYAAYRHDVCGVAMQ